jgi:hypothetical protein
MSILLTEKLVKPSNIDAQDGRAVTVAVQEMHARPEMILKNPRKTSAGLAPRLLGKVKEYSSVLLGGLALELVILFSFNSTDGLFLVVPTLAVGTVVYILDGKRKL